MPQYFFCLGRGENGFRIAVHLDTLRGKPGQPKQEKEDQST